ncbi:MAG: hypothetical protein M3Y59_26170 [Myxococcota bacterium]|nr:hypothetical protein [Myxococcota bacterium]
MDALVGIARLPAGWDDEGAKSIDLEVLTEAGHLGRNIALCMSTFGLSHPALNMTPISDGRVMFTVYGTEGREAELFVDDGSGHFSFLATYGAEEFEGVLPIENFTRMAAWLAGEVQLPA